MIIALYVVQFWSEIIVCGFKSNLCLFDFEITRTISDQIALHSVLIVRLNRYSRRPGITDKNIVDTKIQNTRLYANKTLY